MCLILSLPLGELNFGMPSFFVRELINLYLILKQGLFLPIIFVRLRWLKRIRRKAEAVPHEPAQVSQNRAKNVAKNKK
jgi:pilus assembly protein TadC